MASVESLPVSPASIGAARGVVCARLVRHGLPPERRDAAELVVSELLTNACEHGGEPVSATVSATDGGVRLTVTNPADRGAVADPSGWVLPDPMALSGRGLGIVATIVDDARVRWSDGMLTISVDFAVDGAQPADADR